MTLCATSTCIPSRLSTTALPESKVSVISLASSIDSGLITTTSSPLDVCFIGTTLPFDANFGLSFTVLAAISSSSDFLEPENNFFLEAVFSSSSSS